MNPREPLSHVNSKFAVFNLLQTLTTRKSFGYASSFVAGDSLNAVRTRLATKGDLEAICHIEDGSFSDPYPQSLMTKLLREYSKSFFVAEASSGKLVGYCVCSHEGRFAHLISIGVLREYRRSGVGSSLIETLLAHLSSRIRELWLEVNTGNQDAVRLYEGLGFSRVMILENYYADGSPALRMRLSVHEHVEERAAASRRHTA